MTRSPASPRQRWYHGVSRYQWLVLIIASAGWVFDVYEGQIFVANMNEAMAALLPDGTGKGTMQSWNNYALAAFLVGGAVGGVFFGWLSDRIGRAKTLAYTILMYSVFTCLTAFATDAWQLLALRFVVAIGVGGEWAVASAMVAEVFPDRLRAQMGSIFHSSSVLGTWLATLVTYLLTTHPDSWLMAPLLDQFGGTKWRAAFVLGALPAFLVVAVRLWLKEPPKWQESVAKSGAGAGAGEAGGSRLAGLFKGEALRSTLVGVSLATVGLATFWGVHVFGKDFTQAAAAAQGLAGEAVKSAELRGMFLTTTGGGLGLFFFGPICAWLGRIRTFAAFHIGGFLTGFLMFRFGFDWFAQNPASLWFALPVFGFFTLGMHAGYAIYFPELYPTRLRGTGAGFCFNAARLFAAPILILTGFLTTSAAEGGMGLTRPETAAYLSCLYLAGLVVLRFAPETRDRALPK
ncbi:MAG: MFS transporter [Verrucomicrobiales bacterium]